MRIAHAGISQQHALLGEHPVGEPFGAELIKLLLGPGRRWRQRNARQAREHRLRRSRAPDDFRIAIDDDIADETQQPGGPVALAHDADQLGRFLDEFRRVIRSSKARVRN